ncbi:malectin domain-containing carbohydrate-binding protein [Frankia sp. AgB32]|uniref:malectin domain-containing carbohydrate-binding protein n=1 Tax=Frankia sp. AgB32 TaxID=631119 RepID=UPI00200CF4E3|nr:malectin domain-containing carbohydrate-binding protein [Frankia sp. AgB32]MCK9896982.1 malectin [Frankia sp. AgB32]
MATWPEYCKQAGAALAGWMAAHPWAPPADPDPDPPVPVPTATVRINCGGPAVTVGGVAWEADRGYTGGTASAQGAGRYGTDVVMETERWGDFTYTLTGLPPGPAVVRLHLADSYAADTSPGMRVFDVAVQGSSALRAVDPVALAGGPYRGVVREVPATIGADGRLTVAVTTVTNAGCVQGLEVLCYGTGTPTSDPGTGGSGGTGTAVWLSGGNPNNNRQDTGLKFGTWRGKPITCALHYPERAKDWGPLTSAAGYWTDKTITLIVQIPPFPQGSYTYAAAAKGRYEAQWKQLAQNWKARTDAGFPPPVFSMGWEANHSNLHYWGGPGNGAQHFQSYDEYVTTWQRFSMVVRAVDPRARLLQTWNGHDSPGFGAGQFPANDPRNIYVGKGYLDGVGVDYYDHYPPSFGGTSTSPSRRDFAAEAADVNGVRWYADFAWSEGLEFWVPEWACNSSNLTVGGGDNPTFVTNMVAEFARVRARGQSGGECYYDDDAQRMSILGSSGSPANPRAAVEYQRLYRSV